MKRDLLTFADLTRAEADRLFALAARLKADRKSGRAHVELSQRTLALIFHKPSLRTRLSFEVAMTQLGGSSVFITEREIGIGSREAVSDVARVLSGYVDGIMIRTFDHDLCVSMARHATVPVINGLTDWLHPCQILADLFTLKEHGFDLDRIAVAFIGDGNNVANSWIEAAGLYGLELRIACPEGYEPDPKLVSRVSQSGKGRVRVLRSPAEASAGAHVLYTDVWASMGQEAEREKRLPVFRSYQVNASLLGLAAADAVVLHCLPAHRGEEITEDVLEGPRSLVFAEAENRMHLQKAVLYELLAGADRAPRTRGGPGPSRKAAARTRGARKTGAARASRASRASGASRTARPSRTAAARRSRSRARGRSGR
jgi:ornithine carbamoyltransferase